AVGAGPGDDRDAFVHRLDDDLDDAKLLLLGHRHRLAGRAAGNEPISAVLQVEVHQTAKRGFVNLAIAEGSDHRDEASRKHATCPPCLSACISRGIVETYLPRTRARPLTRAYCTLPATILLGRPPPNPACDRRCNW